MNPMTEGEIKNLIEEALSARDNAYSPYSQFNVGAAVLCTDGSVFRGANIENASYGLTNCAERTAIFSAVAAGKQTFRAIAVIADTDDVCAPCGACRQVLAEFSVPIIIMANLKGDAKIMTMDELLPFPFIKSNLEKAEIDDE